jgi:hypothetical protein
VTLTHRDEEKNDQTSNRIEAAAIDSLGGWGSWQLYLQPARYETTAGTRARREVHLSIPIVADFRVVRN